LRIALVAGGTRTLFGDLEFFCTNNHAEYEVSLFGLELLVAIGGTHIEAFGDSLLVVQQVSKVFQSFDKSLNVYLDTCLDITATLDSFSKLLTYLDMKIAEQMSWHSKHPAITFIMACFKSLKSQCLVLLT